MFNIRISSNRLLPDKNWGLQYLFFVVIRKGLSAEDEARVYEHEKVHIRQFWVAGIIATAILAPFIGWWSPVGLFAHSTLYMLKWYRKRTEIEAFVKVDILRYGKSIAGVARALHAHYRLGETKDELERQVLQRALKVKNK